jgi:hypothetical protein
MVDRLNALWMQTGGGAPFERYGLAVWDGPGGCWRLDDKYGQYVIIDDSQDAVVTITAHEESGDWRLAELAHEALASRKLVDVDSPT